MCELVVVEENAGHPPLTPYLHLVMVGGEGGGGGDEAAVELRASEGMRGTRSSGVSQCSLLWEEQLMDY